MGHERIYDSDGYIRRSTIIDEQQLGSAKTSYIDKMSELSVSGFSGEQGSDGADISIQCRYCFKSCSENVSMCKCQGVLCRKCFNEELNLTSNRENIKNRTLECTVCKTKYIYMPVTDSYYLQFSSCIKTCKLENPVGVYTPRDFLCYNMPNKQKLLLLIFMVIILLFSIWLSLYVIMNASLNSIEIFYVLMSDIILCITVFMIYLYMRQYAQSKFPYYTVYIFILYTIRTAVVASLVNWSTVETFAKMIIVFDFIYVGILALILFSQFIARYNSIHDRQLNNEGVLYVDLENQVDS